MSRKKKDLPITTIQFGDGNFIRAYIDWMFQQVNEKTSYQGAIASIQSTKRGLGAKKLTNQHCNYHLLTQGYQNGQEVNQLEKITVIQQAINPYEQWQSFLQLAKNPNLKVVFSNTTEAGIVNLQESYTEQHACTGFPAKLVQFLYERYKTFNGNEQCGMHILPLELIERNGSTLQQICQDIIEEWHLPQDFQQWFSKANYFYNTLVDRMVPGFPKEEANQLFVTIGEEDQLLTVAEPYHLLVIEGKGDIESVVPFQKAGLQVLYDQVSTYHDLKVNLLNAPHTIMANTGFYFQATTVAQYVQKDNARMWLTATVHEIMDSLSMERAVLEDYYQAIMERFRNPFMKHSLQSIQLSNMAKLKARLWPNIERYIIKHKKIPKHLTTTLWIALVNENSHQQAMALLMQWSKNPEIIPMVDAHMKQLTAAYEQYGPRVLNELVAGDKK